MTSAPPRIREAGDSALLLELDAVIDADVNARAIRIAAAVREARIAGVRDVVSTYRSVCVFFDPLIADPSIVVHTLRAAQEDLAAGSDLRTVEIPVVYGGDGGPDLEAVAARAGISKQEVVERHAAVTYRVFMLGFLPGFAYLGSVDPSIATLRHSTPRLRVPGGSVGIAGRQTGVYPRESPGGWQLIGRTPIAVFDPSRTPPSLMAPGDQVRFVPVAIGAGLVSPAAEPPASLPPRGPRHFTVLHPGMLTTIQDAGRWGHQALGVSVSGAMDSVSHRMANLLVGNPPNTAALEVTVMGPELRLDTDAVIAISGADLSATAGSHPLAVNTPTRVAAGTVIRGGERKRGARAYVAFDGGIATTPVLGSRATHVLSALGGIDGRALKAGDEVPLHAGTTRRPRTPPTVAAVPAGGARLRVLPGPQDDFFNPAAMETLQQTRFTVTAQSDRMGYRLAGRARIERAADREMISDATFVGGIQVPPSGDPILLMADRQTTGGYPQIATVISADLPLAGQLAPGDWVEFQLCTRAEAIAALIAQEAQVLAVS